MVPGMLYYVLGESLFVVSPDTTNNPNNRIIELVFFIGFICILKPSCSHNYMPSHIKKVQTRAGDVCVCRLATDESMTRNSCED